MDTDRSNVVLCLGAITYSSVMWLGGGAMWQNDVYFSEVKWKVSGEPETRRNQVTSIICWNNTLLITF